MQVHVSRELNGAYRYHKLMKKRNIFVLAIIALVPAALGQGLPELGDAAGAFLSASMEKRIGEEAYRDFRYRDANFVDDPEVTRYVNELGGKLVAASPDRHQGFEFFVLQDNSINAFAMPGGYIGVHTGLLLAAQSESEVAGVLAHEVSHVTQHHIARMLGKQSDASVASVAAMVIALLAARSSPDLAQLTFATASAGAIQAQLNYSRDFEREADRVGFQLLNDAGFDVHAMAAFFERLQKAGRLHENNAPAYLRTHPLSVERMADMQNRAQALAYKQVPDTLEFYLIRAKLRAGLGDSKEAVSTATEQLRQRRYTSEASARYFLTAALIRDKKLGAAERELENLRSLNLAHPMIDMLAARLQVAKNQTVAARSSLRNALSRFPSYQPLRYALIELLQDSSEHAQALSETEELLKVPRRDARVYAMRAKSFAATGQQLLLHQALAEQYYLMGTIPAAIDQLQMAQKSGAGNFYQLSVIEARLREMRGELATQAKLR